VDLFWNKVDVQRVCSPKLLKGGITNEEHFQAQARSQGT